jgi:uncharacterized protein (DUF433 family)
VLVFGVREAGVATTVPVDIGQFIYSRPDFRNGRPHIAGTGMSVRAVAAYYKSGMSPDRIADGFPHIPRSHIYAALAYYFADREAMDAELAAEQAEYDRLAEEDRRTKAAR